MKKIVIVAIKTYQLFLSTILKNMLGINAFCRHEVTCSSYAVEMVNKKGVIKGGILSLRRVINCNPIFSI